MGSDDDCYAFFFVVGVVVGFFTVVGGVWGFVVGVVGFFTVVGVLVLPTVVGVVVVVGTVGAGPMYPLPACFGVPTTNTDSPWCTSV